MYKRQLEAENENTPCVWNYAIDIPEEPKVKEFTMEEIAELLNIDVKYLKIIR